jgi:hypothetical protein
MAHGTKTSMPTFMAPRLATCSMALSAASFLWISPAEVLAAQLRTKTHPSTIAETKNCFLIIPSFSN